MSAVQNRLDPELAKRANLTPRQLEAVQLHDPGQWGAGYEAVGRAMGISKQSAADLIGRAHRKLARVIEQ